MGKRKAYATPRAVGGGRSLRYEEQHATRGYVRHYAPAWSDATAAKVLQCLESGAEATNMSIATHTLQTLGDAGAVTRLIATAQKGLGPRDKDITSQILLAQHEKVARSLQEGGEAAARKAAKAALKPMRERRAARTKMQPLSVGSVLGERGTFHQLLAKDPEAERLRPIANSAALLAGLNRWPLGWLKEEAVVCYARAEGRVAQERGGRPDAAFLRGVVQQVDLPTAVAKSCDHYVVISAGGTAARFMTVEEVARGFMVPAASPLMAMLAGPTLKMAQAVSCLGRSVHVGVARQIVAELTRRGLLSGGLTYGSAYSGIDTFAAAVDAETGGAFTYAHASESDAVARRGLLAAWSGRGLTEAACHWDAAGEDATRAAAVDLFVCTPTCEAFSKRNHHRDEAEQLSSLTQFWSSLAYVRRARPRVVVVENVGELSATGPLTGLLQRLEGYALEGGVLDPREVAKSPMVRERHFWILARLGA